MAQLNMTATAVAFLGTDVAAQRLVISWPIAAAPSADAPAQDRDAAWAQASGLPLVVVQKLGLVLRRHGLVRDDGTIAPEAVAVLNALAARKLKEIKR